MLLAACSHRPAMSREELHSIVRSSISLAKETEMSLDFVAQGRSTQSFANGHFRYIAKEMDQNVRQLSKSEPNSGMDLGFMESQGRVKRLASELTTICSQATDTGASTIPAAKQRIREIREALEKTSASL
jgi:hypothetical protein